MCIINQFGRVQLYHLLTQECIPVGCVPTTALAATRCHYGWGGPPNSPSWGRPGGWYAQPLLDADLLRQTQGGLPNPLDPNPLPLDPDPHSPLDVDLLDADPPDADSRMQTPLPPWTEWHTLLKTLPSLAVGTNVSQFQHWRL